ncbi:MAG: SRPBCC family protein [Dokdonella sp.]|uniref:SRPBCC family protein n=1 Tax=Dokdonella sp. TaxID=2291710 RepID=UPI003266041D
MNTDRIEKTVMLHASRERVWRAISSADEFGLWFGVAFKGSFAENTRMTGTIVPTTVDADVARMQEPHAGMPFEFVVDRIEPMDRISFRWHPFAMEPGVDYSHEPMTHIVFELEDSNGGTRLTITESGFDRIPIERRAKAFAANEGGWEHQSQLVGKYLALHAGA